MCVTRETKGKHIFGEHQNEYMMACCGTPTPRRSWVPRRDLTPPENHKSAVEICPPPKVMDQLSKSTPPPEFHGSAPTPPMGSVGLWWCGANVCWFHLVFVDSGSSGPSAPCGPTGLEVEDPYHAGGGVGAQISEPFQTHTIRGGGGGRCPSPSQTHTTRGGGGGRADLRAPPGPIPYGVGEGILSTERHHISAKPVNSRACETRKQRSRHTSSIPSRMKDIGRPSES